MGGGEDTISFLIFELFFGSVHRAGASSDEMCAACRCGGRYATGCMLGTEFTVRLEEELEFESSRDREPGKQEARERQREVQKIHT